MKQTAEVVICGAGIAGISAAYHLGRRGFRDVVLVDYNPPLSLTSDKSTECYRNWWPGPDRSMVAFMNRSIDLMEALARESRNAFNLSRRGYLYLTGDPSKIPAMLKEAQEISAFGAGPLRVHRGEAGDPPYRPAPSNGFEDQPDGADLILDPGLLHRHFPGLTRQVVAGLHVRRAGWFSSQQLGAHLLERARASGARLESGRVTGIETRGGRVQAVRLAGGRRIETGRFVIAAGPMVKEVGRMLDLELPVFTELHLKVSIQDRLGIIPRQAPLLIWTDTQTLSWSPGERKLLGEDPGADWLLDEFPPGVHTRPEGGPDASTVLMLWEYRVKEMAPVFPIPLDRQAPEVLLRGLAAMLPGLQDYFENLPRPFIDGGYYTKTRENRPLIGPLPVEGAYLVGALSGYGLMAACAAGELLADHISGAPLPEYAPAFGLERYQDPSYLRSFEGQTDGGQL